MEGARESGHRAEKVSLRGKNIGYCIGCEACHQNNGVCVQKDDMAEILGKMIAADVIVMATPVYFYTMDAQMKTLIDRPVYGNQQQGVLLIATAADGEKRSLERTIEGSAVPVLWKRAEKRASFTDRAWKKAISRKACSRGIRNGRRIAFRYADSVWRPGCGWTAAESSLSSI